MSILQKPIITEKTHAQGARSIFCFKVDSKANKTEIRKAVERQFGVNVLKISTIVVKGRTQRNPKTRQEKKLPNWKKATVTLKKDQTISLFEATKQ